MIKGRAKSQADAELSIPLYHRNNYSTYFSHIAARLMDSMDATVDPCQDFYQYACGSWMRKNVIPDDKTGYSTFTQLNDEVELKVKGMVIWLVYDRGFNVQDILDCIAGLWFLVVFTYLSN